MTGDKDDDNAADDDAVMFRSHSVDNENPQTPEEQRDTISEFFQTGKQLKS